MTGLYDGFKRKIDYMRISVTDRCNLRCFYCNTRNIPHLEHGDIMRYEEIQKVVQAAAVLGVKSVRITGGEPLVRPHLPALIELISEVEGIDDISLTTNGILLERFAPILKGAGLSRVNVSLDTLIPERFKEITGSPKLKEVLKGIEAADKAGLGPIKINTVIIKGCNDGEIENFAEATVKCGWNVRFIEHMPLTESEQDGKNVITVQEIKDQIESSFGRLEACGTIYGNGPAKYYKLPGANGTLGFISPMSECFCETCNRFRLTSDGHLRPCLLADDEIDIKTPIRNGATQEELQDIIKKVLCNKPEKHELEAQGFDFKKKMWQIGG